METALMREILCELGKLPESLWWRVNVGVAKTMDGRTMRYGLPGQADICGCFRGRHVEVEVKTDTGVLSEHQKRWRNAVERAGGVYVVARRPADALNALHALEAVNFRDVSPMHLGELS
jgi:hypothetical protein